MNKTLLGLVLTAVTVGAQVARADDWETGYDEYTGYVDPWGEHPAVPVQQGHAPCGPRPGYAPQGQTFQTGHYELQNVQRWVPGQQQQVWVPGQCFGKKRHGRHHRWGARVCTEGAYQTVWTPGRYETRQEWVWVASGTQYPVPGIKVSMTF
jgi:hypothetical protein